MKFAFVGATILYLAALSLASMSAQTPVIDLTGQWKGTASDFWVNQNKTDGMFVTLELTQTGSAVTGTATSAPLVANDGSCSSCHRGKTGTVTGTVSNNALSLTMTFPGKTGEITPHCSNSFTGSAATLADINFNLLYTGADSCEGPFTNGNVTMVRQGVSAPVITTQPSHQIVNAAQNAQFTVAASGNPAPSYRWQVSANGGALWTDLADAAPYSGATTATLNVTSATTAMNGYRYRAFATSGAGSAVSSAATLTVNGAVTATPATLQFGAIRNGAAIDMTTAAQNVAVTFAGQALAWTAVSNQPWLQLSNASGGGAGSFTAQIVASAVPAGATSLAAAITLAASGATNSPVTVPVALTITLSAASVLPIGSFDSPAGGSTVAGSIAVTGWALDDIGVERVEIWRDKVGGETTPGYAGPGPGNGKVFVADATFVSGARPDVEAAYPTYPQANRAGWGSLLLTQGLWNQGNGTYTLHAFAYDKEGHVTTLGFKTIIASNATSTKPFGAIDTPSFGQVVSGRFWNFGWALTPNTTPPCTIPVSGVQVSINSGPLQPVTYGDLRGDIAAAFPGFTNSSGAGGAHYIDTTALSNGAHQIGWFVVDNCGRQDGIGSRIFSVLNTGTAAMPLDARPTLTAADSVREVIVEALIARRGFDVAPIEAGVDGEHVVTIAQGERIEIEMPPFVGATGGGPAAAYTAYQIVNGTRRALPAGSTFDADGGVFYWQPAPAFLGAFDLEFVRQDGGVVLVRVVVQAAVRR